VYSNEKALRFTGKVGGAYLWLGASSARDIPCQTGNLITEMKAPQRQWLVCSHGRSTTKDEALPWPAKMEGTDTCYHQQWLARVPGHDSAAVTFRIHVRSLDNSALRLLSMILLAQ
jgi:hypothetical protein